MKKLFLLLFVTIGLSARIWRDNRNGADVLRLSGDILQEGGMEEQIEYHKNYDTLLKQKDVDEWYWKNGKLIPVHIKR